MKMADYYYESQLYYENEYVYEESVYNTYKYCMEPTVQEILPYVWKMLACNILFRMIISCSYVNSITFKYISSAAIGMLLLFVLMRDSLRYIVIFLVFCIITLKVFYLIFNNTYAYIVGFIYFIYLTGSEFFYSVPSVWAETRGVHMVITMKLISLMFDVKSGHIKTMPGLTEITAYVLCPSNCLLGPFISYNSFSNLIERRIVKLFDFTWIVHSVIFISISLSFLLVSNCWTSYFNSQSFKWIVAYQEALSFRSSHYFVSFLSSAMLSVTGLGCDEHGSTGFKSYLVTKPHYIEMPRSLVQVVVYWNMPIHLWLKKYVFKMSKPLGNFTAVILTYIVSSFLHGFNTRLAAVLLSLGCYTYVEYEFRNKLSNVFDACLRANPCRRCAHKYKTHLFVHLTNIAFSALAIFHLAYLGCLMDNSINSGDESETNPFEKWSQLNYASHIVTATIYLFHKLV